MPKKKLQLKGEMVKKLTPEQLKKAQTTLEVMQATREEDTRTLRSIMEKRLEELKEERTTGLKAIAKLKSQHQQIVIHNYRIEGSIRIIEEILNPKKEENTKPENA